MHAHAVLVALALVLAPLGAQAADLVVWWEKGYYPQEDEAVAEIIAAFEQETGKQVELVLPSKSGASGQDRGGARGRPAARLRLRHRACLLRCAMGLRRSARGSLGRCRRLLEPVRSGRARPGDVAQREDRTKGPVRAADRSLDQPPPRLEEPPGAGGLHACRHPEGVGGVLVVLVRPGPAGGAPGHGPRRHLGHRPADVGRGRRHLDRVLPVRGCLRGGLRDPRRQAGHRRSRDQAKAGQGHGQLHRDLPQGLHAARFGDLGRLSTTTRRSSPRRSS